MAGIAPPDLDIPPSTSTVDLSIIDTTSALSGVPPSNFFEPVVQGHDYLAAPAFAFLIQHPKLDRTLVFDLGVRKDWWNYAPVYASRFSAGDVKLEVKKSVREILEEHGFDCHKIEGVVWSHWHVDHVGNPAEFEKSTALIVGPGFKANLMPGYANNPQGTLLESDWAGRDLIELSFPGDLTIGKMEALDYFGDGSFYFLDTPGHAIGHVRSCASNR